MEFKITVENIKCGGCANSVRNKVLQSPEVEDVVVNVMNGTISIIGNEGLDLDRIQDELASIGYPPAGEGTRLQKMRSYVSCMIGRMDTV